MDSTFINNFKNDFKNLASKYDFNFETRNNEFSLRAKTIDDYYYDWIIYEYDSNDIYITGNTDQCNFWFCETRPDLTSDKLMEFIHDINEILAKIDICVALKTLIDPEDYQEIAGIPDAYTDPRYADKELSFINETEDESDFYM